MWPTQNTESVDINIYIYIYIYIYMTAGEEALGQLYKNIASNIEQVLTATPHKHQLYGHHENYPS